MARAPHRPALLARADPAQPPAAASGAPRRPASPPACPPITSRPGVSARASPGFAWSFLGAALAQTSLPFGIVNAPGQRYHPAIIAQAAATLCEMFPERLWIALGTGEASNEHITGEGWPPKADPHRAPARVRGRSCGRCSRGEEVSHVGHVVVDRARLWTLPRDAAAAAVRGGERGDRGAGAREWADGLATVNAPVEHAASGCSTPSAPTGRKVLQVHVSWAPTQEEAVRDRARPVAHERLRPAGLLGPRHAGGLRRRGAARAARGRAPARC